MNSLGRIDTPRLALPQEAFQRLGKRLGLKPSHFAHAAEVSWPTAKAWFSGETTPTLAQLDRLIAGLQAKGHAVSIADFLTPTRKKAA